jgi:hypothetical protein
MVGRYASHPGETVPPLLPLRSPTRMIWHR